MDQGWVGVSSADINHHTDERDKGGRNPPVRVGVREEWWVDTHPTARWGRSSNLHLHARNHGEELAARAQAEPALPTHLAVLADVDQPVEALAVDQRLQAAAD